MEKSIIRCSLLDVLFKPSLCWQFQQFSHQYMRSFRLIWCWCLSERDWITYAEAQVLSSWALTNGFLFMALVKLYMSKVVNMEEKLSYAESHVGLVKKA